MRVRYGGVYKTVKGNRDIYFRISSVGFNWYPIIWSFVNDHKTMIDTVTITRDLASTGSSAFYCGKMGLYDHMPTDEFLTESASVRKHLAFGGTVFDLYSLPSNPERIKHAYEEIKQQEDLIPKFWYEMD